ncbi:uncharacterized protein LOC127132538 isoform X1 [Lathyrus oleraceus]|uniref:uncharacterized protein LOC127132538 isoform X1 n=1 Tax=Pisum sativum TaxID=3888 RepID=UPI0021CFF565|nr:uncharacterized protein LOC127132538 isoform X1 [Pisum sativum]
MRFMRFMRWMESIKRKISFLRLNLRRICMAKDTERKMHCAPQPKGNDSPKVSEAGKNSKSTTYPQQDKVTSLEVAKHSQGSSVSKINSDSRCAILTFLSVEPDGTWRILAVPVQCLNHINLASGINMDGLQLLFPPPAPLNRSKNDQCKGSRRQVPLSAYTAKSYERSFTGSNNVRRRCQNKVANKACKLKELPADSCAQSSVVSSSPSLSPHSSASVISSDKWMSNTNEDKSLKKASKKRARKKQIKNQSSESGSNDREVRPEEYGCVSLTSETCSSNDVDTTVPEFSSSDDRFIKIDCDRNEMNDKVNVMDAPKHCDPRIEETLMSKAESKSQLHDRETKDTQEVELCGFNDIQDTLVLDAVSIGSKSDESVHGGHIGKQSNKASCGDEYLLGQGLTNGFRSNSEHEETRNGGQNCIVNDKRVQHKRTMSKSSSFNKFAGIGGLNGRTGKENSHSVWQKVQKNSSSECGGGGGDLKKVSTPSSQFISTTEKDTSAIKNCNSVGANVVSGGEVKKQAKNKGGRKSKGKTTDLVLKKGPCNYSRKGSNYNRTVLNDNVKGSIQPNDSSNISSQDINQQGTIMEFQTSGVKQESSEPVESDIQNISQETKNESIDIQSQVSCSDEQSQVSCNLLDDQVGQTLKEVSSADYNAQNHSSGSSQWKWIPVGKKDTGITKSESEYSDEPTSKNSELENSLKPKTDSFSQNQDSSPNNITCIGGQIEGKNHKLDEKISGRLVEHGDKHEVANHMIYECENQYMFNESYRIAQAVNDTFRVQLACEVVHKATGGPVAEFERLLHFCSPVICRSLDSLSCLMCSQNYSVGSSLCRHEIPEVPLGCLWEWYEKHGSYGLEIRAWDYENPKTFGGVDHFPFRAYFVPSLSAIQLFKNRENRCVKSNASFPNCKVSEDSFTTPINDGSNPYTDSTSSGDLELLFEYFECEQPQQRRPLYERIQELIRGNVPIQSKTYGDATKLDSIILQDLHPRSWYSVAWYPIYRIPDGNFRASFLTYHSLGHLVRRSSNSDSPTLDSCVVSPVVGLQSYNAQGECWFQLNHSASASEMLGINPSIFLKERLRTLEETASLMARAVVNKGNQVSTNRHPDYEFFLSRRRY